MSLTERLYWIDAQIRDGRYPDAAAVAAHFGVSERTAFKDRNHLLYNLGAPLKNDQERGGWYYTDPTYNLPFLALSESESATLRRSLLAAQEYLGPTDAGIVGRLFERLAPYIPTSALSESMGGSIHPSSEARIAPELLADCRRAVRDRHKLRLLYYSVRRDEQRERVVQPYHLYYFQGEPYLIAWCEWRQAFRQFFLGRVREWKLLEPDMAFVRDASFDADTYLKQGLSLQHGGELVTIRVRFTPYQARWIRERQYHPSQQIEEQADGGLILTLTVTGTEEAKRWLLSYGAEAEALEPESLRAEIAAEWKKIGKIYSPTAE